MSDHSSSSLGASSLISTAVAEKANIVADFELDCEQLLALAVGILPDKQGGNEVLSISTLFFAAVEWGLKPNEAPPLEIVKLADRVISSRKKQYNEIRSEFFSSGSNVDLDTNQAYLLSFKLSKNFSLALQKAARSSSRITAGTLMTAVLRHAGSNSYSGAVFTRRLKKLGIQAAELEEILVTAGQDQDESLEQRNSDCLLYTSPSPRD